MITAAQEVQLAASNGRSMKKRQDKTNPMVINIDDGRLMPNTEALRKHPKYRVYGGPLDAPVSARMKWLAGALRQMPKVTNSKAESDVFDVGTATADDLVVFAMENWGAVLDPTKDLRELRKAVMKLAEVDNAPAGDDLS